MGPAYAALHGVQIGPIALRARMGSVQRAPDRGEAARGALMLKRFAFHRPHSGVSVMMLLVGLAMLASLLVPGVAHSADGPDLTVIKSNNVNGSVRINEPWTWTLHVANTGTAPAVFAEHEAILQDQLPENLFIHYGQLTVENRSGITGAFDCGYVSSGSTPRGFVCFPDGESVSLAPGGSFDVTFSASSSADFVYPNPAPAGFNGNTDPAGRCAVDPSNHVVESNEGNNNCSDTVTVATEDLQATKTNDVSSSTTPGSSWTWTIDISNFGNRTATFADGKRILVDTLPDQNISYGAVTVGFADGAAGPVACAIDAGFNLTCSASGGSVSLPHGSSIQVSVAATASAAGQFANPRNGGVCFVNPDFAVPGGGDSCSDTVLVGVPDLTVTKTNTTNGRMFLTPVASGSGSSGSSTMGARRPNSTTGRQSSSMTFRRATSPIHRSSRAPQTLPVRSAPPPNSVA
jgi:CARDB